MIVALNNHIIIQKFDLGRRKEKEIYIPLHQENYYEVVEAANAGGIVKIGDKIVVKKEQLHQVFYEGKEYFIIHIDHILAKCIEVNNE